MLLFHNTELKDVQRDLLQCTSSVDAEHAHESKCSFSAHTAEHWSDVRRATWNTSKVRGKHAVSDSFPPWKQNKQLLFSAV